LYQSCGLRLWPLGSNSSSSMSAATAKSRPPLQRSSNAGLAPPPPQSSAAGWTTFDLADVKNCNRVMIRPPATEGYAWRGTAAPSVYMDLLNPFKKDFTHYVNFWQEIWKLLCAVPLVVSAGFERTLLTTSSSSVTS